MAFQTHRVPPPVVHIVFPAQELAVRRALLSVCASLKSLGVTQETLTTVEIILAEVTNNIVEHAYPKKTSGTITLSCFKSDTEIRFEITDHGAMLPGGELPPKKQHDLNSDLQDLPEGGFGWGLIRDLTRTLEYQRQDAQNILRFTIERDSD